MHSATYHGLIFGDYWDAISKHLKGEKQTEARYEEAKFYFLRDHWPITAAFMIMVDRHEGIQR